jgi:hypothetical protein
MPHKSDLTGGAFSFYIIAVQGLTHCIECFDYIPGTQLTGSVDGWTYIYDQRISTNNGINVMIWTPPILSFSPLLYWVRNR